MRPDEPRDTGAAMRDLADRVSALERRANDFALKGQILGDVTPSFETGIDRFFAEPEFWENPYDSSQADCSRRCSEAYRQHLRACDDVAGVTARESCRSQARAAVIACHATCA
jgi:hypothetical protein